MSERRPRTLSGPILEEATRWFVELNENAQDAATRAAFNAWLRTSPEHVRAFLNITVHWEESAPPRNPPLESIDELVEMARAEVNVVRLDPLTSATEVSVPAARRPDHRRRTSFLLAASILLTVFASGVWFQSQRDTYSTDIGEQRSIRLDDGSTVELNSRSRITIRYTSTERHIDLSEGQALFHVTRDEHRPFVVQSRGTQVRAVGTQFDVYRKRAGTVVTVVEGKVAVIAAESPRRGQSSAQVLAERGGYPHAARQATRIERDGSTPSALATSGQSGEIFLTAGEQVTLADAVSAKPQPANIAAATAWTQRRLIFNQVPLSEVVEEFNRYNPKPLVLLDATLGATQISGTFSSSEPSSLMRFLRDVGAYNVRETDSAIEISSK